MDDAYERRMQVAEEALRPLLTDETLSAMAQAVRTCGWEVDHTESTRFVEWCYEKAGKKAPPLDAIDYDVEPT